MADTGKTLLAIIAGVAVGVVIGVLIAPQKGTDTRQKLNDGVKDLADSIISKAEEVIDKIGSEQEEA